MFIRTIKMFCYFIFVFSFFIAHHAFGQEIVTEEIMQFGYGQLTCVTFAPDGKTFFASSSDGKVREWDIVSGEILRTFKGHTGAIFSVTVSPDGTQLLTGSHDFSARLWDRRTGLELLRLEHDQWVRSVAFSPDGAQLVTGGDDSTARLWDISDGQEIHRFQHDFLVTSVMFSPDGTKILTGGLEGIVRMWDASSGQKIHQFNCFSNVTSASESLPRDLEEKLSVVFSPNGKQFFTGCTWNETAQMWDMETGEIIKKFVVKINNANATVDSLSLSPDGTHVLTVGCFYSGEEKRVCSAILWDVADGNEILRWKIDGWAFTTAFSPDGSKILTGSWDGTARIWDAITGKEIYYEDGYTGVGTFWWIQTCAIGALAFSPDGSLVLIGSSDTTARLWDVSTGKEIYRLVPYTNGESWIYAVAFSPDGNQILTGGYGTKLFDVNTGQEINHFKNPFIPENATYVHQVKTAIFSPDGKHILSGSGYSESKCYLWDIESGELIRTFLFDEEIQNVCFSQNGTQFLTGQFLIGQYESACFGQYDKACLWDKLTGDKIHFFNVSSNNAYTHRILSTAFTPDENKAVVLVGENDGGELQICDVLSGEIICQFETSVQVDAVALSPDGRQFIAGCSDGTVLLWDILSGQEILRFKGHSSRWRLHDPFTISAITFSPDGTKVLTGGSDGTARLWDISHLTHVEQWSLY